MAGEKGHLVGDEVAPAALRRDDHGPLGPPGGLGSSCRRRRGGGDLAPDGATRAAAGPPGVGGDYVRSRAAAEPHGGGGEYGRSRRERHRLHGFDCTAAVAGRFGNFGEHRGRREHEFVAPPCGVTRRLFLVPTFFMWVSSGFVSFSMFFFENFSFSMFEK